MSDATANGPLLATDKLGRAGKSHFSGSVQVAADGAARFDGEIRWPDGKVEKFEKVKANQILKLVHEAKAAAGGSNGAK